MKAKHLLYLCSFICLHLSAQVAGPDNPSAFSNALIAGYTQPWTNITNVGLDDETYANFGNIPAQPVVIPITCLSAISVSLYPQEQ
jgi:hypothetical protein